MGFSDPHRQRAYHSAYMAKRYRRLRREAIEALGGKCVRCGATDGLEFDHVDPKSKKFEIASEWSLSVATVKKELDKCQLLCSQCHIYKTTKEDKPGPIVREHGTYLKYDAEKCRCEQCKLAYREWKRAWRLRTGETKGTRRPNGSVPDMVTVVCPECGVSVKKKFKYVQCVKNRGGQSFCSLACAGKHSRRKRAVG